MCLVCLGISCANIFLLARSYLIGLLLWMSPNAVHFCDCCQPGLLLLYDVKISCIGIKYTRICSVTDLAEVNFPG
ncbi:unnamed protein product [Musa acuminata subsp. malaccensis]|uniref:(wild Malaysian banana) hypothetical protein n=1 Tax=Musa acuminata subsp. malaccensis TaxID=214687 RepID=A0A8D7AT09_MUSAM|nr:unnamed protein product [Musa acuminata subsp. malaccensis]